MTTKGNAADASLYYHEDATADIARMDSSAVYGNLADAMKNSIVRLSNAEVIGTVVVVPFTSQDNVEPSKKDAG